jgi:hypothetical protein
MKKKMEKTSVHPSLLPHESLEPLVTLVTGGLIRVAYRTALALSGK